MRPPLVFRRAANIIKLLYYISMIKYTSTHENFNYIAKTYGFNYLYIGLIMTAFGIMSVIGGRMSGKLAAKIGARKVFEEIIGNLKKL